MPPRPSLEYARRGLIGVLVPQANVTVEPEFAILLPAGFAAVAARLTSPKATVEERLLDYVDGIGRQIDQFANAPIDTVAFAATGASYLIGRDREDALVARLARDRGLSLITAARAVCDALAALEARRVALVSPYPPALTERSVGYWESRGFEVAGVVSVYQDSGAFHPIYALGGDAAEAALRSLGAVRRDATVLLGTGMPSLRAILAAVPDPAEPVLSCTLALAWRAVVDASGGAPEPDTLRRWIAGTDWGSRLRASAAALPEPPRN